MDFGLVYSELELCHTSIVFYFFGILRIQMWL